ncbi:MAG: hypothetical protein LBS21_13580 [Clostridiales bacterium]|nr:hypothetical protein [Clostridiales bacterium]
MFISNNIWQKETEAVVTTNVEPEESFESELTSEVKSCPICDLESENPVEEETESELATEKEEPIEYTVDENVRDFLMTDRVSKVEENAFNLVYSRIKNKEFKEKYLPEKWLDEISKTEILDENDMYTFIFKIDENIIVQYSSYDPLFPWRGNCSGVETYYFMNDSNFFCFSPANYSQYVWFYIADEILYVYELTSCGTAFRENSLSKYDINNGEKVGSVNIFHNTNNILPFLNGRDYDEYPYSGDNVPYSRYVVSESNIPGVTTIKQMQKYMLSISDTWYH